MQRVASVIGTAEAQVQMQARAAAVVQRPAHVRGQQAAARRDLVGQQPKHEGVVGRLERVAVANVHLVRRRIELAPPPLDVEPARNRRPHDLVHGARWVDGHAGAVHAVRGEAHRHPVAVAVGLHQIELELVGELRDQASVGPRLDGLPERLAAVERMRRAPVHSVGHGDHGVGLP